MPTRSSAVPGIVVGLQIQGNPCAILYNPIGLRRDCKTAMDCQGIERLAKQSWKIHNPHANLSKLSHNSRPIAICRPAQKPWDCRHNLSQSWGLRLDYRFKAIHLRSCTIQLDCDEIVKPQRIARNSKELQRNPGKSTDHTQTMQNCPRIHVRLQSVGYHHAIQPKSWKCRHNLLQSQGLRLDGRFNAINLQSCNLPKIVPLILQPIQSNQ